MTRSTNMEHVEVLRDALRKAFRFGETHWQQADSEYTSQHRKAGETMGKFKAWADETAAAIAALSAQQPPAEAQAVGEAGSLPGSNGGFTTAVFKASDVPVGTKLYAAPPSAPVGVDELVRKVCERLDKVADYAHTIDDETVVVALSNLPAVLDRALSEALAQQPAAVDGDNPYPAPRNRQEAAALAKLALAYLGVTSAHIDAVVARCETDLAGQQGGSDNDR